MFFLHLCASTFQDSPPMDTLEVVPNLDLGAAQIDPNFFREKIGPGFLQQSS